MLGAESSMSVGFFLRLVFFFFLGAAFASDVVGISDVGACFDSSATAIFLFPVEAAFSHILGTPWLVVVRT